MHRIAVSLLVLAACGGSSSKTPEPAKARAWKDMGLEERTIYMTKVVMPKAKELFVAFDPKYSGMDCVTCHGAGAADGSYEMPNADIKALPNSKEAFMAWVQKDPEVGRYAEFMATKLEPLMGELLQKTVFDPATKTGELSCHTCHTLVDASGKPVEPEKTH